MKEIKQYYERDAMQLDEVGGYYFRHVLAMTAEGLHSKSEVAAELGWRDMQIAALQEQVRELAFRSNGMTDEDKQQIFEEYNAAMCASNEAGYAGITAAETIRYLIQRAEAAEAEIARRDAAAGEPAFYIAASDVDNLKRSHVVEAAISKVIRFDEIPVYTAAPPADAGEPVYQLWSPGIDVWVECNKQRYDEWAHMPAQRRTLYTAVPPAVLPPEKPVNTDLSRTDIMKNIAYNQALNDVKALGAQPQKPVVLPEPHAHLICIQTGRGPDDYWDDFEVSRSDKDRCCDGSERYAVYSEFEVKAMLEAANVPYELKK